MENDLKLPVEFGKDVNLNDDKEEVGDNESDGASDDCIRAKCERGERSKVRITSKLPCSSGVAYSSTSHA